MSAHFDELVSYKNILRDNRGKTDEAKENSTLCSLRSEPVQRMRRVFATFKYEEGRTQDYSRDQLYCFYHAAAHLGLHLNATHPLIQASHALRAEIGLPPPSQEALDQLADHNFHGEVVEDGFPTRQAVNGLTTWLREFFERTGIDPLAELRRLTYVDLPAEVIAEHQLNTKRLTIDSKVAASASRYGDRRRKDEGASTVGKQFGRYKQSAVLGDIPLVLASQLSRGPQDSQETMAADRLIPQLGANCKDMEGRLGAGAFRNAAIIGDGAFLKHNVVEAVFDSGFHPCFRNGDQLTRQIIGQRELTKRGQEPILVEQADDGTLFCPCTRGTDLLTRTPMRQITHESGRTGKAEVWCDLNCHETHGIRYFTTWGSPTHTIDGKPVPAEQRTLVGVSPVWKGDIRTPALIHKLENGIENYHKRIVERTLMGHKDHSHMRRRVWGDFANEFWWTVADLVWNSFIRDCLAKMKEAGDALIRRSWTRQFYAAVAMWRRVKRRKEGLPDNYTRGERSRRKPDDPQHAPMWAPGRVWLFHDSPEQ